MSVGTSALRPVNVTTSIFTSSHAYPSFKFPFSLSSVHSLPTDSEINVLSAENPEVLKVLSLGLG